MVVTAAATSILSLYVTPVFADSPSEGTPGGSLGALSGTPAAFYDESGGSGYGDDDGSGDDAAYEEDSGYGHDSDESGGYGADDEPGGYGDPPPEQPPTTPRVSPPPTTPPVTTPPPATPPPILVTTPPASPVMRPLTLAETGPRENALVASGLAALLLTSGTILYRRGRAGSPR
ncbi:hypothetical protein AB0H86_14900 [Streptomyces sp. NPDC050997]|uniref:hypothetical protein n=1 Tax=Streptomyces sp. NPDC050997 TaxID=3155519 RepID=UPI00342F81EF